MRKTWTICAGVLGASGLAAGIAYPAASVRAQSTAPLRAPASTMAALARNVRQALQATSQVTLREIAERHPLRHGLAELVAYLQLDGDQFHAMVDEGVNDTVSWRGIDADGNERSRGATMARVIFVRPTNG